MTLLLKVVSKYYGQRSLLLNFQSSLIRKQWPQQVARFRSNYEHMPIRAKHLFTPFLFTLGFCSVSVVGATICRYENTLHIKKENLKKIVENHFSKIRQSQKDISPLGQVRRLFYNCDENTKVFLAIFAINTLVFLAWKIPYLNPIMMRYFVTSCEKNRIRLLPMIFSNFSHNSFVHYSLNMFVLYSFTHLSLNFLGKENFWALYLGSGVVSAFTSYVYKIAMGGLMPSLGASGAILGILASCCIEYPDMRLMIIFLPFFSFTSAAALKGLIIFDAIGCILRWGFFDHAAHLGGTLFGIYYSKELKHIVLSKHNEIINKWIKIKKIL